MKKAIHILFLAAMLCGCEVIGEQDRFIELPMDSSLFTNTRTHVLVEFTGFRCVNCPTAAEKAQELSDIYTDKLIVVAMHPQSNPFTQGAKKYDYTCPEADSYYQYLGGTSQTAFPAGNINLRKTGDNNFCDYQEWTTKLAEVSHESSNLHVLINDVQLDPTRRKVQITVDAYAEKETDCRLAIWVVEDSILGAQAMPDGSNNMAYYHRHVLRQTIGGDPWGMHVQLTPQSQSFQQGTTLPEEWNMAHCHLVAVLMDEQDKQILNAAEYSINNTIQ